MIFLDSGYFIGLMDKKDNNHPEAIEIIRCNFQYKGGLMYRDYKVQNNDLKNMLVKKANDLHIPLSRLIWNYVNRGLMGDNMSDEKFNELHSEVFLKEVDDALGLNN